MQDSGRLFILGLGAQKTGTTWLYDYIASAPNAAVDGIKEYHIWDAIHLRHLSRAQVSKANSERDLKSRIQFALQQHPAAYFHYFDHFLATAKRQVTCDITPNYAGLGSDVLGSIRQGFAGRGIATRAIFLIRDPVERCWSAARMQAGLRTGNTDIGDEQVLAHVDLPGAQMRTRYDLTIAEMEKAFPAEDRHVGIYEEMFRPDQVARISAFCRLPARPEQAAKKVFATPATRTLKDETRRAIAARFRPVYDFAAARYPQVKDLWSGFRYL